MKVGDMVRLKPNRYPNRPEYSVPGWVVGLRACDKLFTYVEVHFVNGIYASFFLEHIELVASIDIAPTYNGDAS